MKMLSIIIGHIAILAFNMADMCWLVMSYGVPWLTAMGIGLVPCIVLMDVVDVLEGDEN